MEGEKVQIYRITRAWKTFWEIWTKVAGTAVVITAIQMDTKYRYRKRYCKRPEQARKGRLYILDKCCR